MNLAFKYATRCITCACGNKYEIGTVSTLLAALPQLTGTREHVGGAPRSALRLLKLAHFVPLAAIVECQTGSGVAARAFFKSTTLLQVHDKRQVFEVAGDSVVLQQVESTGHG
jgi:hypothetical protein